MLRFAAQVGLAVASVALVLVLGEIAVRAFGLGPTFFVVYDVHRLSENPALGYELKPASADGEFTISSAGLRDREFSIEKPAGVYRIAAIGDSVTYGAGCAQDETFPKRLEELLNRHAAAGVGRFEVLNFGVSGYNIRQVAERLRASVLAFDPDLVVYAYALNDPQAFSNEATSLRTLRAAMERELHGPTVNAIGRALGRSRIFLLARYGLFSGDAINGWERDLDLVPADPGWVALQGDATGHYFRRLHLDGSGRDRFSAGMAELGRAMLDRDVPIVVAVFPLFLGPADPYPLADLHELITAEARKRLLHTVDLQPVLTAARQHFERELNRDFIHLNPFGHRVAAAALLWWLEHEKLLPAGALDREGLARGSGIVPPVAALMAAARAP